DVPRRHNRIVDGPCPDLRIGYAAIRVIDWAVIPVLPKVLGNIVLPVCITGYVHQAVNNPGKEEIDLRHIGCRLQVLSNGQRLLVRLVDIAVQYTETGVDVRVDFVRYGGRVPHKRIRLWDLRHLSPLPHRVSEDLQRLPPAVALHGQLELDSAAASAHGKVTLVDMPLLARRGPKTLIPVP